MADENGFVYLYTTEPCGFCRQAKTLLQSRGVDYREINLAKDPVGRAELVALTGQMTFPQVLVGERSIGGFWELVGAGRAGLDRAVPERLDGGAPEAPRRPEWVNTGAEERLVRVDVPHPRDALLG